MTPFDALRAGLTNARGELELHFGDVTMRLALQTTDVMPHEEAVAQYAAVFQRAGAEGVTMFPVTHDLLGATRGTRLRFWVPRVGGRLWHVVDVTTYAPADQHAMAITVLGVTCMDDPAARARAEARMGQATALLAGLLSTEHAPAPTGGGRPS